MLKAVHAREDREMAIMKPGPLLDISLLKQH